MRGSRPLLRWVLSAICLTVLVSPELAASQTLQSCLANQNKYTGTGCRGLARCYVKAMRRGVAVDPGCITTRAGELESRFNSVEAAGVCLVEPGGPTVSAMVGSTFDSLATSLTLSGGKCAAGKMGGLGRECKQLLRCYTDSVYESSPVDPGCLDSASGKLLSVFSRLETKYTTCATTGDAAARDADVLTMTDDVFTYLRGVGTTTTSTTQSSTTTLPPGACEEDGSINPCVAYRDNPACTTCVDTAGGIAQSQCTAAGPTCADAFANQGCGYSINTATTCGPTCCP